MKHIKNSGGRDDMSIPPPQFDLLWRRKQNLRQRAVLDKWWASSVWFTEVCQFQNHYLQNVIVVMAQNSDSESESEEAVGVCN